MAKDHFVAQFYLHGFTDPASPNPNDPGVWVVDRRYLGKPKRKGPGAIAFAHGYNDWTDSTPSRAKVSLEQEYGELETWAAPIIRKLDRRDTRLDAEERDKLAMFMAVHMSRPPGVRETVAADMGDGLQKLVRALVSDDDLVKKVVASKEADIPAGERTSVEEVRSLLSDPDVVVSAHPDDVKAGTYAFPLVYLTPLLLRCRWGLRVVPKGRTFLTCDRPLLMMSRDPERPDPDYTLYDNSHITAFFPLTREVALEMEGRRLRSLDLPPIPPGARIRVRRLSPGQTTVRNRAAIEMADCYIFCSDEAQAQWALSELQSGRAT